jgi:hypothetical protein
MSVNTTSNIDGFLAGLDTTAKPFQRFKIEDIEETKGAMQTIAELISVIDFLKAHEAPAEYSEAVETAMGGTRAWVCRDIEKEILRLVAHSGSHQVHKSFLSLQRFAERQEFAER